MNHQECLLVSDSIQLGRGPRTCISGTFPGGAVAALEDTLRTDGVKGAVAVARKQRFESARPVCVAG